MVASMADDNVLQIWQMAENIYSDDDSLAQASGVDKKEFDVE